VTRRQFALADCVVALALLAIAFVYGGVGAVLLIAGTLGLGHVAAWYCLRNAAGSSSSPRSRAHRCGHCDLVDRDVIR
jgi:hypothetical protein